MKHLLSAGIRMFVRHSRLARITLLAAAVSGTAAGVFGKMPFENESVVFRPDVFVLTLPLLFLLTAVTLVVCIGQEQGSGTLRNKLIAGYSKLSVGGAWIILTLGFSLLTGLLYLLPMVLLGGTTLRVIGEAALGRTVLTILLLFLIFGVLSALLSLMLRRQIYAAIGVIGLAVLSLISAAAVRDKLEVPEYTEYLTRHIVLVPLDTDAQIPADGGETDGDGAPDGELCTADGRVCARLEIAVTYVSAHPYYTPSPKREVLTVLNRLNPADALTAAQRTLMSGISRAYWEVCRREGEAELAQLTGELKQYEGKTDTDSVLNAEKLRLSIDETKRAQQSRLLDLTQEAEKYADETRSIPQCMLAVLILLTAAGLAVFRRLGAV